MSNFNKSKKENKKNKNNKEIINENNQTNERNKKNHNHSSLNYREFEVLHLNNTAIPIPIIVDTTKKGTKKSFTMTDPSHRYRTFNEILLVKHHPEYLRKISDFQFVREAGKGGFGTVWLANDLKSGIKVAIKELHKQDLEGRKLISYLREITTIISAQGKFICPFVGYTIDPPYSIITEFIEGELLSKVVRNINQNKTKVKPKVYGTQLTIICLCIAYALKNLHSKGIMHRDIKAGNVMIGQDGLPVILDFGVSRQMSSSNRYSIKVGTITHMAPEMSTNTYDNKVDVFSFAMLLYEVGELNRIFPGIKDKAEKVHKLYAENARPTFTSKFCTLPMRELITKCWAQDPADRPSFEEIFDILSRGDVYFKGADPEKIINFAETLKKEENDMPPRRFLLNTVDTEDTLNKLTTKLTRKGPLKSTLLKKQNNMIQMTSETIIDKMIMHPAFMQDLSSNSDDSSSNYELEFKDISENLNDIKAITFFESKPKNFKAKNFDKLANFLLMGIENSYKCTKFVLKTLQDLATKDHSFLDKYHQFHILPSIFLDDKYERNAFYLLYLFFWYRPWLLDQSYSGIIVYFIQKRPLNTICMFSKYIEQLNEIIDPFPIFDMLIKYAKYFMNISYGDKYIYLLYNIISLDKKYKEARLTNIISILIAFLESKSKSSSIAAMNTICNIIDENSIPIKINSNVLIKFLFDTSTCMTALSLLKRLPEYPISLSFIQKISNFCWKLEENTGFKFQQNRNKKLSIKSTLILLKFASQSFSSAELLAKHSSLWLAAQNETIFHVFLVVYQYEKLQTLLLTSKEFPRLLLNQLLFKKKETIDIVAQFMKKISKLTPKIIDNLEEVGFYKELITNSVLYSPIAVMLIIEISSKYAFEKSYIEFIPFLIQKLCFQNEVACASIHTLTILSFHNELKDILHIPIVINYFELLLQLDSLKNVASIFLENINQ